MQLDSWYHLKENTKKRNKSITSVFFLENKNQTSKQHNFF
jgi:hypothetical protein